VSYNLEVESYTLEVESYMQTVPDRKSRPINNVDHQTEATVVSTVFTKQDKVMDMLRSLTIRLDTLE